jgi:predicted outer membrane lipoprotein
VSTSLSIDTLSAWAWALGISGLLANFGVIYGLYLERTERKGDVERPLRGRRGELWVIIGIVAEIVFGTAASISANRVETRQRAEIASLQKQAADANERAGQANERAAKAEKAAGDERLARLEFERPYGPRRLSEEQRGELIKYWSKVRG